MSASELEINERLNVAALHLDNEVDKRYQHHCLPHKRKTSHNRTTSVLPFIRTPMKQITDAHKCKYFPISYKQLTYQFGVKRSKQLPNHGERSLESGVPEENPTKAYEVKRQHYGKKTTYTRTAILFGTP